MVVGTLELALRLEGTFTLKDKRQIVRSVLDRARHDLHVSASEVGDWDLLNSAVLGYACVGPDPVTVNTILDRVVTSLEARPEVEIIGMDRRVGRPYEET